MVDILERVFSRPHKVKYGNIHLLAILASALYRYHQEFVIGVVDNVLESITLGLELNDFKFNQKRVAEVKYLGELYNYKMIDSPVIFDALYRIVAFGHGMLAEYEPEFDFEACKVLMKSSRKWNANSWEDQCSRYAR